MKDLSFINKIAYLGTVIVAVLLLLACLAPYVTVSFAPYLVFTSLAVPALVVVNIAAVCYWLFVKISKIGFSVLVLLLGYFSLGSFYKSNNEILMSKESDIKVMTFNSCGFQGLNPEFKKENGHNIIRFIEQENPDVICFQEFDYKRIRSGELNAYPYSYVTFEFGAPRSRVIQAIYSKFPIISKGDLKFPKSANNGIYADILIERDTLRFYNLHLETLGITPGDGVLINEPSEKVYKMLTRAFIKQEEQALLVKEHKEASPYKSIICGDFNNVQYSRAFSLLESGMVDTFKEKGSGLGKTFSFHGIPVLIDFILVDDSFKVKKHFNYDQVYSDHFPVMASFSLY